MDELTFPMPPEGMLTEQADLLDYQLVLGLLHPPSADGVRVVAWDGEMLRHLTSDAARKWADDNDASGYAKALKPVSAALRALAESADRRNGPNYLASLSAARKVMGRLTATSEVAGRA